MTDGPTNPTTDDGWTYIIIRSFQNYCSMGSPWYLQGVQKFVFSQKLILGIMPTRNYSRPGSHSRHLQFSVHCQHYLNLAWAPCLYSSHGLFLSDSFYKIILILWRFYLTPLCVMKPDKNCISCFSIFILLIDWYIIKFLIQSKCSFLGKNH